MIGTRFCTRMSVVQSTDGLYLIEVSGSGRSQFLRVPVDDSRRKIARETVQLRSANGFGFAVGKRTMISRKPDQNLPPFTRTLTIMAIEKLASRTASGCSKQDKIPPVIEACGVTPPGELLLLEEQAEHESNNRSNLKKSNVQDTAADGVNEE